MPTRPAIAPLPDMPTSSAFVFCQTISEAPMTPPAAPGERHRVAGDRPRLAAGAVLAPARAEQQQRGERAGGADEVDDRRAGEVLDAAADLREEAAAEDPVRAERVDQRGED